ncbi:lysozyme inhibitor LprI family protein [Chamaesiphon sp. GL140_3_metabinner_50]|uniref:lysozyme inhibitor LprI family protein n=1 Tax=Chamaesiphon sp. GL140_3_metabinner_50 TaxID=2970812 RepID=UPI0025EDED54|nr:lysozyme inhibitor LprI family protein [Chamaesiphon sp. GL140_3_metabinner_50]
MKKYLALFTAIVLAIYLLFGSPVSAIPPGNAYTESDEFLYNVQQDLISKISNSLDKQRLMAADRAWIKFRDAEVNFYSRYYVNSKGGLALKIKLTDERALYLQSMLKQLPQQQGKDIGPI